MSNHALSLRHVSKRFASHVAIADLSLAVPHGSIYGILGPNGAGKTTTLRMAMNIIARDSGSIEVLGRPPESRKVLRRVGYLPEERGLYRRMTVSEVILFFGRLKGLSGADAKRGRDEWLERMGLTDWRSARIDALSKGMQQKVQFITTVLHRPELLILDEPQSGLDPVNQEVLRETILRTRDEGGTVVLSTHNMDQAEALCDYVCIIAGGVKVLDGALGDVRRRHGRERYRLRIDAQHAAQQAPVVDGILRRARVDPAAAATLEPGSWEIELNGGPAHHILGELGRHEIDVESFARVEPTLHEIFLAHAGEAARRPERRSRA